MSARLKTLRCKDLCSDEVEANLINIPEPMANLTPDDWKAIGISRIKFEDRWKERLERDKNSPEIGSLAPDFELEIISQEGNRTGKLLRLSSLFGKPIGLIFGSYT
ncbi:MAG: hypothetical protein VX617_06995 [Pseudomonadota bacterium]|nr:hypothetical protein [Pseudomonadota bacterium]